MKKAIKPSQEITEILHGEEDFERFKKYMEPIALGFLFLLSVYVGFLIGNEFYG